MDWYYLRDNQPVGPITAGAFEELVRRGTVRAETPVWHEGLADWTDYGELASPPPTKPPPEELVVCANCGNVAPPAQMIARGESWLCPACHQPKPAMSTPAQQPSWQPRQATRSPLPATAFPSPATATSPKSTAAGSLLMGSLGAVGGMLVGMIGWFLIIKLINYEIGYAAWGVGVLTGLGARWAGRGGSPLLGGVAAACAVIAILGGEYLAINNALQHRFAEHARQAYDRALDYAREAVKVEGQSEEQLVAFLTAHRGDTDDDEPPSATDNQQLVREFRDRELPRLRALVEGKPSRQEFERKIATAISTRGLTIRAMRANTGIFTLLWFLLGIGSAFRLASGDSAES